ncbi:MAG: hypothetical protein WEC84_04520 [Candidatus Andersenbacteria bacterium]
MRRYTFLTPGVFWRLLLLCTVIAGGKYGWDTVSAISWDPEVPEPEVRSAQDPLPQTIPDMELILVHVQSDGSSQVYACSLQCLPVEEPSIATEQAVFDGRGWYVYRQGEESNRQLAYMNDEEDTLLVDHQTQRVELRDLFLSPNGQRLAYYLDDAESKPTKTELWMYDKKDKGAGLLIENLTAADVITKPRWNTHSSHLWFLADSGAGDEEQLEFVTVQVVPPAISARFSQLDLEKLKEDLSRGIVDMSANGNSLAFAASATDTSPAQLMIAYSDGRIKGQPVVGAVVHVQWMSDNLLLYATQHQQMVTFWTVQEGTHTRLTQMEGMLRSTHANGSQYLSLLLQLPSGQIQAQILDSRTGLAKNMGSFTMPGGSVHLVQAHARTTATSDSLPSATYSDAELTAFIQQHVTGIATDQAAKALRVLITDQPNTVYVDVEGGEQTERLAVVISEIIHPDWKVIARYRAAGGQWQRTEGITEDPKTVRMYEWEESVSQWILKQDLDK